MPDTQTETQRALLRQEAPDQDQKAGYAMERTTREYARLRTQARFWEPATRRALDAIGVAPGMRCLDVGCGPGEGLRLLAEHVGPQGSVTGVDVDPTVVLEAGAHVRATTATAVQVVAADFRDLAEPPAGPYDLVTVRLVLLHLPDPVAALRKLYGWLRPGGALLVQEYDFLPTDMWPPIPLWPELVRTLNGIVEALGGDPRCGIKLPLHFTAAGLGEPEGTDVSSVLVPIADTEGLVETAYRSVLPQALRLGLTTERLIEGVLAQMREVADDRHRLVMLPNLVACWARKPA